MSFSNFGHVKPSFMIIGVQKGGTSSLFHYLSQHPQVIAPKEKELHYFDTMLPTPTKPYVKMFPKSYFTRKISFDATPNYIYFPGTANRIYQFDPAMKFIVILRDPVKRAFSAWNMHRQMVLDPQRIKSAKINEEQNPLMKSYSYFYSQKFPTFSEWIDFELSNDFPQEIIEPSIIRRGYYLKQIKAYLECFSKEKFLFVDFDDFKRDLNKTLNDITNFLELSTFDLSRLDIEPKNKRSYKDKLSDEIYQRLLKHYKEENQGLVELVDIKLNWMH